MFYGDRKNDAIGSWCVVDCGLLAHRVFTLLPGGLHTDAKRQAVGAAHPDISGEPLAYGLAAFEDYKLFRSGDLTIGKRHSLIGANAVGAGHLKFVLTQRTFAEQ